MDWRLNEVVKHQPREGLDLSLAGVHEKVKTPS